MSLLHFALCTLHFALSLCIAFLYVFRRCSIVSLNRRRLFLQTIGNYVLRRRARRRSSRSSCGESIALCTLHFALCTLHFALCTFTLYCISLCFPPLQHRVTDSPLFVSANNRELRTAASGEKERLEEQLR